MYTQVTHKKESRSMLNQHGTKEFFNSGITAVEQNITFFFMLILNSIKVRVFSEKKKLKKRTSAVVTRIIVTFQNQRFFKFI